MSRPMLARVSILLLIYIGCVNVPDTITINVNIRHIQEQADEVLDYVEGKTDELPELAPMPNGQSFLRNTIDFLNPVQTAYAQEINESSARAQQILKSMRDRHAELESAKKTGAVGENNRGVVEMVYPDKIADATQRNEVQRIVAAENQDRKAYYQEIARLNRGENLSVGIVERVYAQRRLMRAQTGELFQMPPAGEDLEKFKSSAQGKSLGAAIKPNEWLVIK